jgi:hypothetical protein
MGVTVIVLAAELLQLPHQACICTALALDEPAELGMVAPHLCCPYEMRETQPGGGIEAVHEFRVTQEVEEGLQGILLMGNDRLTGGTPALLAPSPEERA